jgi:hypothetical protein
MRHHSVRWDLHRPCESNLRTGSPTVTDDQTAAAATPLKFKDCDGDGVVVRNRRAGWDDDELVVIVVRPGGQWRDRSRGR